MYSHKLITLFLMSFITRIFLISTLFSAACSVNNSRSSITDKAVFKYNEPGGILWLDPAKMSKYEDFLISQQLFNGLVSLDDDLNLIPSIAHSWEISNDGKTYTFNLRQDVFFHASDLLNEFTANVKAEDVAYSFSRIINPATASPGRYIFDFLIPSHKAIVVVDDYTLEINLIKPQPSFIYQLCLPYGYVIPSEVVEYYGTDFSQHVIGTGPFFLNKWKKDVKLILGKNSNYFEKDESGNKLPYLDGVSVTFIQDKNQEYINFKAGKLDMISGLDEDGKDNLLTSTGELNEQHKKLFYLDKTPWLNTDYIGVLVDDSINKKLNNPLMSKELRNAIGYSIDREKLVKFLRNGVGVPASSGFIPKGMPGFEQYKIKGYTYDLNRAQNIIRDYPKETISITLSASEQYKTLCEYLQNQIQQLGINVAVDIHTNSALRQRVANFDAVFYRKSWVADFPEPMNYFQLFYGEYFFPENGTNYYHFKNAKYDSLYLRASEEQNKKERYSCYKQMQEIIHDYAPVIPLFYAETLRFYHNYVLGISSNSMNMLNLKKVKISRQNIE